jgi:REP element-mobilizing transposase RayT
MSEPLAYFLTWHTYGTWLPGDVRGSVDGEHRRFGDPFIPADPNRVERAQAQLSHEALLLDEARRLAVQQALVEVCQYRQWVLLALHVRTNHVHAIVAGGARPEKVLNDFKAYATRRLRRDQLVEAEARVWAGHGSTRYLWTEEQVMQKVEYVVNGQGAPLEPRAIDNRSALRQ